MPVTDRKHDLQLAFEMTSVLAPDVLFDLLADPQGYMTWCPWPNGMQLMSVDAAPGPALTGAVFVSQGTIRGVPFVLRTHVVDAERPRTYATDYEMTFQRGAIERVIYPQRYDFEPLDSGSRIRWETTIDRKYRGLPYLRPFMQVYDRFFAAAALQRSTVEYIRAAERYVKGAVV